MRGRRGATLALVVGLYMALVAMLLGAVTVAVAGHAAASREYLRSQARWLAEAGIEEFRAGAAPHAARPLGAGRYGWSVAADGRGQVVTATGEAASGSGLVIRCRLLVRVSPTGVIQAWEERS